MRRMIWLICLSIFMFDTSAIGQDGLHFSGRFEGVLCEKLANGQFVVLDRVIENSYLLNFNLLNPGLGGQLQTAHQWKGQTQNGLPVELRQAGPARAVLNFENGSVAIEVVWEVKLAGKICRLPFQYSSTPGNFPPGILVTLTGPATRLNQKDSTASLTLKGFQGLDTSVANQLAIVLRENNQRPKSWNPNQLFVAAVFVGNVTKSTRY